MLENIIVLIAVRATVIGAHVPEAVITALRSICAGMMCAFQLSYMWCGRVFYTLPKSDLCSLMLSVSTQPGMSCRSCVMSHHINAWSCVMSHHINAWSCVMSHHINAWSCVMSHHINAWSCVMPHHINAWSCVMSHHINAWSCVMSHHINAWSCVMPHHINAWSCVMSHDVMWCLLMAPTVWCDVCELKSKFTTLYLCVTTVHV